MANVNALGIELELTDTASDEADNVVTPDGGWYDVKAFLWISADAVVGAAGASFTVLAKKTANSTVETTLYAKAASATDAEIMDAVEIKKYGWLKVLIDTATAGQTNTFCGMLK